MLGVAGATSALAVLAGLRRHRAPRGLRDALLRVAELAGLTVAFLALNLAVGIAAVLVLRRLSSGFYSIYLNTDATLLVLSLLQAAAWQWWGSGGRRD